MMATVRRVVCVLAAALCCTALCVSAAADTSAGHPTVGASDVSAKQTDVTAKTEAVEAARKAEEAAISFKDALREAEKAQKSAKKAAKKVAEEVRGKLKEGARKASGLGYRSWRKTSDAVTLLKDLVPADSTTSVVEPSKKEEKAKGAQKDAQEATELAEWAVTNATKAVTNAESRLKEVNTEEQKVKAAMEKAKEAAGSIPKEAKKVVAAIEKSKEEAIKASGADMYLKKLNDGNKAVKDILDAMNATLIAAKKAEELAKNALSDATKGVKDAEHKLLVSLTSDGLEAALKGVEKKIEALFPSIVETEEEAKEPVTLLENAISDAESVVELAKAEKLAAEAALRLARQALAAAEKIQQDLVKQQQQAREELEAAKGKEKEREKQGDTNDNQEKTKQGILESEVSERDEQEGLNRPQLPDTTDAATTPPAGALLPKTDGTADGEKLLAQHTDGS
ncbi:hypothetical protein DQ04_13141000, partial [Trypanosoma grayi]|uniref:hypothetical protein n=1 Tax=Trypanosoma grayi TaxID=71804 RepID=UPI0004F4322B